MKLKIKFSEIEEFIDKIYCEKIIKKDYKKIDKKIDNENYEKIVNEDSSSFGNPTTIPLFDPTKPISLKNKLDAEVTEEEAKAVRAEAKRQKDLAQASMKADTEQNAIVEEVVDFILAEDENVAELA